QQKRNDQDDNRGREDVNALTLVTIDSATRTALHDLVQAPSTHGIGRMIAMFHAALAAEPRCLQHHLRPPAPRVPALKTRMKSGQEIAIARRFLVALAHACRAMCARCG